MPTESIAGRKQLVKSSKKTARRYKESGFKVEAGSGRGTLGVAAATATGAAIGAATATGTIMGGASLGAVAGGVIVLAPVLAVGSVIRGVNQSKVNKQIQLRQTELPLQLEAGEELALDMFFPIAPSPTTIELTYTDLVGEYLLVIDTSMALDGLHIEAAIE